MNKNTNQQIYWMSSKGDLTDPRDQEPNTTIEDLTRNGHSRILQVVLRDSSHDGTISYPYLVLVEHDL